MHRNTLMQVPHRQIPDVIVHNSPLGAMHYSICIIHPYLPASHHGSNANLMHYENYAWLHYALWKYQLYLQTKHRQMPQNHHQNVLNMSIWITYILNTTRSHKIITNRFCTCQCESLTFWTQSDVTKSSLKCSAYQLESLTISYMQYDVQKWSE